MQDISPEKEYALFEGNVELRVGLIKKKLSQYFLDVDRAVNAGKEFPLPKDEEDAP